YDQAVEVAVALGKVEAVADDVLVLHGETAEAHTRGHDAARLAVEQRAHLERTGPAALELAEQIGQREARIDNVLDEHDVATGDVNVEILEDAHPPAVGRVVGDGEEVDDRQDREAAHEVGDERDAPLEHRRQHQAVVVGVGQLGGQ